MAPTEKRSASTPKVTSKSHSPSNSNRSPDVVINPEITQSKLDLLNQSPLRRLIPEKDRKAAAAQLAANNRKAASKSPHPTPSPPAQPRPKPTTANAPKTPARNHLDKLKLGIVKKKEARRMRWKVRKLRKDGKLPHKDLDTQPGVMYLAHIPHGFYESEITAYFAQFGPVLRVRLSRSVKTARSRGYAFVEFADEQVAQIAADAMDGYLMHGQKLVAKFVPNEKLHPDTFKGANRSFRHIPWSKLERRAMLARANDPVKLAARSKKVLKAARRRQRLLLEQGLTHTPLQLPR